MENLKKYFGQYSYQAVDVDSKESLQDGIMYKPASRSPADAIRTAIIVCLLISNISLAIGLYNSTAECSQFWATEHYKNADMNRNIKKHSAYSPVLDRFELNPRLKTFNGALRDNSSIWRQPPSPEVDAAWDYISAEMFELITVSEQDILLSGKDPSKTLQAPLSWGYGEGAYIVQVDVFHQIHCLNELRKEMHHDYYYDGKPASELHHHHKAHCVHMLLQALMCSADVGIITHNWVHNERIEEPKTRPMSDFNVVKKCADFNGLLAWTRKNAVQDIKSKWPLLKYEPGMPIVTGEGYA